ncbi:phage tail tip lysozyme [Paraburkholderia acidicola]|nr:phage tail tip lysozyme [Paraburkholderia acidicola]
MSSAAVQGYSTNPMDYLHSYSSGSSDITGGSDGIYGLNGNTSGNGLNQQQILQIIEELLQMLQQVLQNSDGDDSGGGAPPVGSGSSSGGNSNPFPQDYSSAPPVGSGGNAPPLASSQPPATNGAPPVTTNAPPVNNGGGNNGAPPAGNSTQTTNNPPPPASNGSSSNSGPTMFGLSTAPQTTALSQSQGQQVANQYVNNLMSDFGLTKPQAQGIVANLWLESGGMNSGINQGGQIGAPTGNNADDNANGYGIAQWGGPRKQGLEAYAKQNGLDPSSEAANYGYLKQELQTTQSGAISAVKGTSTAQDATAAFMNTFEKPSDPHFQSRLDDLALIQA